MVSVLSPLLLLLCKVLPLSLLSLSCVRASARACECACVPVFVRERMFVMLLLTAKHVGIGSLCLGWLEWTYF